MTLNFWQNTTTAPGQAATADPSRIGRKVALTAAAGLAILGGGNAAQAYGGADYLQGNAPLGSCTVEWLIAGEGGFAFMNLITPASNTYATGGTIYDLGNPTNVSPPITAAFIEECGPTNVTNVQQDGADSDYFTDGYMGFSFRAVDPVDGKTYDYEFALSGASNTQLITSKVLVLAPTAANSPDTAIIAGAQSQRMNHLIQNQPDLTVLVDRSDEPQVSMSALDGTGKVDASFSAGPFWGLITASRADAAASDSRYVFGSFGAHRKFGDGLAVGLMAEFDHIKYDDPMGKAEGTGWLVGPYVVAKVPEKEIVFDARALWGRTSNDITPTGAPTDEVDGTRGLIQLRAATRFDLGEYQIRPRVVLTHARESTGTFIDSGGLPVPDVKSAINQAALGVSVSRDIAVRGGLLKLSGSLDGIWTNTTSGPDAVYEDGRARAAFGVNYVTDRSGTFSASAFVDGIAQDGYEGRGVSLAYNLRF